jgi:TLP18.3/Psb32/MOLO-1 phosphatase superfamily protein/HEAT repeat protein
MTGLAACLSACSLAFALQTTPSPPPSHFDDRASLVPAAAAAALAARLSQFERDTGNQVVVAIFPELPWGPLETFTLRTANAWGVGQKDRNNGVVLFVFVKDRLVRLEVGSGLETVLTNTVAKGIVSGIVIPAFREGRVAAGLEDGVDAIITALALPSPSAQAARPRAPGPGASPRTPKVFTEEDLKKARGATLSDPNQAGTGEPSGDSEIPMSDACAGLRFSRESADYGQRLLGLARDSRAALKARVCAHLLLVDEAGADVRAAFKTVLFQSLRDPEPHIRRVAMFVIDRVAGEEAVPHLVEGLSDPLYWMRGNAALALGRMGSRARMAVPALIQAFEAGWPQESPNTVKVARVDIATALGAIGPEARAAIPVLSRAARGKDDGLGPRHNVRLAAERALAQIQR